MVIDQTKLRPTSFCAYGGIAASPDGTKVYAASQKNLHVLDASSGSVLSSNTITNVNDIYGVAAVGTNVFVLGSVSGTTTVTSGSVSIANPGSDNGFIMKFTASGNTLTPSLGTWIGHSDSAKGYGNPYKMESVLEMRAAGYDLLINCFVFGPALRIFSVRCAILRYY